MNWKERIAFFEKHYRLIFQGFYGSGYKIFVEDNSEPRQCRFCEKGKPAVTFKNDAHAIPEFLGNHQLLSLNECDTCNSYVSNHLEDHLDKFTKPLRLMSQIRGKQKVPSYKSPDKKSRIDFDPKKGLSLKTSIENRITQVDEEQNSLRINTVLEPYIPTAVYKALCKIAISICPQNEIDIFSLTKQWVMTPDHSKKMISPQILFETFIPGPCPNHFVTAMLFRSKSTDSDSPVSILVLSFGNFIYQLHVPSHLDAKDGSKKTFSYVYFPTPYEEGWPYGKPHYLRHDLTDHAIVKKKDLPMTMHYTTRMEVDSRE